MQMLYRLPRVRANVGHDAIAAPQAKLPGQIAANEEEMAGQRQVVVFQVADGLNFLFWDDQQVGGSLGIGVREGEAKVVFVQDFGRNFLVDDPFEDSFGGHGGFPKESEILVWFAGSELPNIRILASLAPRAYC